MQITNILFRKTCFKPSSKYICVMDVYLNHISINGIRLYMSYDTMYYDLYGKDYKHISRYNLFSSKDAYNDFIKSLLSSIEEYVGMSISEYTFDKIDPYHI